MIDMTQMQESVSLKIDNSEEIISVGQAKWLLKKYGKGCNADCLACHFSELFVRDLSPEDIESVIEGEFRVTDLPAHGAQTVSLGGPQGLHEYQIPDGLYFQVISMQRRNVNRRDVCLTIKAKYGVAMTEFHVGDIWNHWMDSLPRDENGVPHMPALVDAALHPGRQLDRLPTRPFTPLNGRPRTSFSRPPPLYSPRPNFRGIDLRHPREVIPENGHHAPFYDMRQTPSPPHYGSNEEDLHDPPPYSPLTEAAGTEQDSTATDDADRLPAIRRRASQALRRASDTALVRHRRRRARLPPRLQHHGALVARPRRGSSPYMNESAEGYLNWLSRQTTVVVVSPTENSQPVPSPAWLADLDGWLNDSERRLGEPTIEQQPVSPDPASSRADVAESSFPHTFLDMTPDTPIDGPEQSTTVSPGRRNDDADTDTISDTSTQRAARDMPEWPFTPIPEPQHARLANSPYVTIVPVEHTSTDEDDDAGFVYSYGSIARAVLNTYPWRYRPLTMTELQNASVDIDHLKTTLGADIYDYTSEPRAQIEHAPTTCLQDPLAILSRDERNEVLQRTQESFEVFEPGTRDYDRQVAFLAHQAFEEIIARDLYTARLFSKVDELKEWNIDALRRTLLTIKLERESRKHDRETEASAALVRHQVATAMGVDMSTVLAPYDLDIHIEHGDTEHQSDWLATDRQDYIQLHLGRLPLELDIWTEEAGPARIPHPDPVLDARITHDPSYELPTQRITDPFDSLTDQQQIAVLNDLVYEVVNEMAQTRNDSYFRAVAFAVLRPDTSLTLDVLRGVLTAVRGVRAMRIPVETVAAVFGAEEVGGLLGDVFGVTTTEPHSSRADLTAAAGQQSVPTTSSDSTRTTASTTGSDNGSGGAPLTHSPSSLISILDTDLSTTLETFAHPLPIPRPTDLTLIPNTHTFLSILRWQYPAVFSPTLSHFPANTTWTPTLAAGLTHALEVADLNRTVQTQDAEVRQILRGTIERVQTIVQTNLRMLETECGSPLSMEDIDSVRLERSHNFDTDWLAGMECLQRDAVEQVVRKLRDGTVARLVQTWREESEGLAWDPAELARGLLMFGLPLSRALVWVERGFSEAEWLSVGQVRGAVGVVQEVVRWMDMDWGLDEEDSESEDEDEPRDAPEGLRWVTGSELGRAGSGRGMDEDEDEDEADANDTFMASTD